jgi:NAD+ dependent glucose-6-phosphate dehydrogenase
MDSTIPPEKVLVTGATGQIGYMTFDRLRKQPDIFDAYALDRKAGPSPRVPGSWKLDIPQDKLRVVDLADLSEVQQAVQGMDTVVHLAADPEARVWESALNNNIIATYNVFEACRLGGVKRIVAASSIMVSQGHREKEPYRAMMERRHDEVPPDITMITPGMRAEPRSIYAATKVWTESLASVYSNTYDMSCLCIRVGQVERDRPRPPQGADIYCSQRDIVQIIERCILANKDLRFDIYYGMSNNDYRWVDIERARRRVGFEPLDRAEDAHDYDAAEV